MRAELKREAGLFFPGLAVLFAAGECAQTHSWASLGWAFVAWIMLRTFFVQKYPKAAALKWAIKLKKGQIVKVEVEGK